MRNHSMLLDGDKDPRKGQVPCDGGVFTITRVPFTILDTHQALSKVYVRWLQKGLRHSAELNLGSF
jgi:hypothetical protein